MLSPGCASASASSARRRPRRVVVAPGRSPAPRRAAGPRRPVRASATSGGGVRVVVGPSSSRSSSSARRARPSSSTSIGLGGRRCRARRVGRGGTAGTSTAGRRRSRRRVAGPAIAVATQGQPGTPTASTVISTRARVLHVGRAARGALAPVGSRRSAPALVESRDAVGDRDACRRTGAPCGLRDRAPRPPRRASSAPSRIHSTVSGCANRLSVTRNGVVSVQPLVSFCQPPESRSGPARSRSRSDPGR